MLTAPQPSIRLEDEQLKQLEEFEKRLIHMRAEVGIHQRHLKSLKTDSEQIIQKNSMLEEANKNLAIERDNLDSQLKALQSSIAHVSSELDTQRKMYQAIVEEHDQRNTALVQKAQELESRVNSHDVDAQKLSQERINLAKDKEAFEQKKSILLDALKKVGN